MSELTRAEAEAIRDKIVEFFADLGDEDSAADLIKSLHGIHVLRAVPLPTRVETVELTIQVTVDVDIEVPFGEDYDPEEMAEEELCGSSAWDRFCGAADDLSGSSSFPEVVDRLVV